MLDNEKDFETFFNDNFNKEEVDELCKSISQNLMQIFFSDIPVTNALYEKDVFKLVKKLIIKYLIGNGQKSDFNQELSLYIFKKHIKNIFENFSERLMQELAYSNEKVTQFLKYYSLDTLVVNDKRYIVPQIREEDGKRWNVTSMFTILKTYVKTRDEIKKIEENLEALQIEAKSFYKEKLSPIQYNRTIENKFKALESRIENNAERITIVHDSLSILHTEDEISKAKQELGEYEEERLALREEKAKLIKDKIKQFQIYAYEEVIKKIEAIQRDTKAKYKIIEQNEDTYQAIKHALAKALISKKQPI